MTLLNIERERERDGDGANGIFTCARARVCVCFVVACYDASLNARLLSCSFCFFFFFFFWRVVVVAVAVSTRRQLCFFCCLKFSFFFFCFWMHARALTQSGRFFLFLECRRHLKLFFFVVLHAGQSWRQVTQILINVLFSQFGLAAIGAAPCCSLAVAWCDPSLWPGQCVNVVSDYLNVYSLIHSFIQFLIVLIMITNTRSRSVGPSIYWLPRSPLSALSPSLSLSLAVQSV